MELEMKLFHAILASAAFAAVSPALAADATVDVPVPQAAPQAVALPVDMWGGAYAGVFGGYASAAFDTDVGDGDADGGEGGVFVGFNRQIGTYVFGAEGDIGMSGLEARLGDTQTTAEKNVFGSLRGRAGVAFDPVMIYGTAGVAAAQAEISDATGSDDQTMLGYTVGAGVDASLTERMFGRVEYRFSDYSDETFQLGDTSVTTGFDEHAIRAGIGLKF
jgi:outer membrane immunogenic protein